MIDLQKKQMALIEFSLPQSQHWLLLSVALNCQFIFKDTEAISVEICFQETLKVTISQNYPSLTFTLTNIRIIR